MPRTKISEFSATAADNTDIDSINIAEGCAPSGINNAIRELMAQLKDMQTGASGDTFTFTALNVTGNITANFSDERLKTNLGSLESALDKICAIDTFYYEANETAQALGYKADREVGVSAQSVQAVFPELVAPAPIDAKYLTVRYDRLVAPIIAAIKELRSEVKALKGD